MSGRDAEGGSGAVTDPTGSLNRRYYAAFATAALLVLLNQVLVQPSLLRLAVDAPVINVAGRQRMLSQRLAKAALALDRSAGLAEKDRYLAELVQVLREWSASHAALRDGSRSRNSPAVREAFAGLEPSYASLRDAATRVVRQGSPPAADLAILLGNEGEYLRRMDAIVGLYELEASRRVASLARTGWALTGLTLAALGGLGFFVLRPAAGLIRAQIGQLRAAQDELEDHVRHRTRELEEANERLAREAADRALAQRRHRELLELFSHVSRTHTLGEMASSLAHELNQPLGAIANYTEGCLVALDAPSPALPDVRLALEKILATTLRAGQILGRVRRFVTHHSPDREPFDPNTLVGEVSEFLADEASRRNLALRLDLAPGLPWVSGDPVQIQQVLVNLVRNAFDALDASEAQDRTVVMQTRPASSRGVEFRVIDRGEGIPNDRLEQIFDAYFSTRAEGMGMGLAISRTIIEAHEGKLTVESEPGGETSFRFLLPVVGVEDDAAGTHGLRR